MASSSHSKLYNGRVVRSASPNGSMSTNSRVAESVQVAPYLTHIIRHHGQVTLIPPENSGRIRKPKSRKNLKQFESFRASGSGLSSGSSNGGSRTRDTGDVRPRPASSLGTVRVTGSAEGGRIGENGRIRNNEMRQRSQVRVRPSSSSGEVFVPLERMRAYHEDSIPDFPPPSFEEAVNTGNSSNPSEGRLVSENVISRPGNIRSDSSPACLEQQVSNDMDRIVASPPAITVNTINTSRPYHSVEEIGIEHREREVRSPVSTCSSHSSVEYHGTPNHPGQFQWEEDRKAGLSLEERVRRELERRRLSESLPQAPPLQLTRARNRVRNGVSSSDNDSEAEYNEDSRSDLGGESESADHGGNNSRDMRDVTTDTEQCRNDNKNNVESNHEVASEVLEVTPGGISDSMKAVPENISSSESSTVCQRHEGVPSDNVESTEANTSTTVISVSSRKGKERAHSISTIENDVGPSFSVDKFITQPPQISPDTVSIREENTTRLEERDNPFFDESSLSGSSCENDLKYEQGLRTLKVPEQAQKNISQTSNLSRSNTPLFPNNRLSVRDRIFAYESSINRPVPPPPPPKDLVRRPPPPIPSSHLSQMPAWSSSIAGRGSHIDFNTNNSSTPSSATRRKPPPPPPPRRKPVFSSESMSASSLTQTHIDLNVTRDELPTPCTEFPEPEAVQRNNTDSEDHSTNGIQIDHIEMPSATSLIISDQDNPDVFDIRAVSGTRVETHETAIASGSCPGDVVEPGSHLPPVGQTNLSERIQRPDVVERGPERQEDRGNEEDSGSHFPLRINRHLNVDMSIPSVVDTTPAIQNEDQSARREDSPPILVDNPVPTDRPLAPLFTGPTDLDLLLARLEDPDFTFSGRSYDDLLLLEEIIGPAIRTDIPGGPEDILDLPLGRVEVLRRRVTKDGRTKLKLGLMGVAVDKCGICLSQFKENSSACLTPCQHAFHGSCMKSWLRQSGTCPLCRTRLQEERLI